jgi:hypothetical protein
MESKRVFMVDRTTVDVHAMTKVRMHVLVLVRGNSGRVQNGIFEIIQALKMKFYSSAKISFFDLIFDFWSFLALSSIIPLFGGV